MNEVHSDKRLTQRIEKVLRAEIRQAKPGDQLESIRSLARRFEVSTVTIGEALAALVQEGLIEKRHGSGSYVKDVSGRRHIAVLVETDIADLQCSYFYMRVISTLLRFFREKELPVRLYLGHRRAAEEPWTPTCVEFLDSVARQKLSGVVAVATYPHPQWMDVLEKNGVPVVGTAPAYRYGVASDAMVVVREGVRRLLQQGRRKIAWMGWKEFLMGQADRDELRRVFESTLQEAGVVVQSEWIRRDIPPNLAGAGWGEFREIWSGRKEKPDGLLVTDNVLFQDAVPAMAALGIRVPADLAVVCHSTKGSPLHCPFPVDRLEDDPVEFAEASAGLLLQLMRKEAVTSPQVTLDFHWEYAQPTVAGEQFSSLEKSVTK